jgi:iron complex outermembrane receptor protein
MRSRSRSGLTPIIDRRRARLRATALSLLVAAFACCARPARADTRTDDPPDGSLKRLSLEALGNIEVTTASKEPQEVRRSAAAIFVITQEDIRRSGATSLPDVLRLAPGLDVAQIDSDHWSVGVRGFGDQFSKSVLVLIDGRSVYTPLFAGVFWGVQDVLLADVDRIEVIRGPGGTIWGANAVNGIINIISKHSADTHGALASIGGGTLDHVIAGARLGGGNGETFDYRVQANGFSRGPEQHTDGTDFDKWHIGQAGFRMDWRRGRDSITFQGDAYTGQNGQSVQLGSYAPPAETTHYEPLDVSGEDLVARWRRSLAHGSDIQIQAYYDRTYLLGPQIGESRNTFDVDFIHHIATTHRQDVIWGLGARVSPSHTIETVPTLTLTPQDATEHIYSAFVQDEVTLLDRRLWLTVGSKIEHNDYTDGEVQPSVRLLWAPTPTQSFWTAVSRAVRTPSRLEDGLQLTGFLLPTPPTYIRIVGNTAFEPERLLAYEAGYRQVITPNVRADVSIFRNQFSGLESFGAGSSLIELTPRPAHLVLVLPYANGVDGHSQGVEISPQWDVTPRLRIKGAYSYLRIDLANRPGNTDVSAVATYEGSSPRHQVSVQPQLDLPMGWELDADFRYVSALPARQVDAYATVDVRVGWHVTKQITLSASGRNLADADHVEFAHDPGPAVAMRRTAYASVTWTR